MFWWMTRDSNPVPEGTDLQSAAVANAARHPKNDYGYYHLFKSYTVALLLVEPVASRK